MYLPPAFFGEGGVTLTGDVLHHVRTVLRLRAGDELVVTDGAGGEYRVRLEEGGRTAWTARVLERTEPRRESPLHVTLAQAVPKGDRFPFVLQKSVEMGVSAIVPVLSQRTVVSFSGGEEARRARWQRIVEAAVAQSGRTRVPVVHPPRSWDELLGSGEAALKIMLWEGEARGLREALAGCADARSILLAVGPEGGWADGEVERARQAGFLTARIGPRILRTETVALAALAVLQYVAGDLG
jgi:16S rRNA (uracil1498-N3)-methyltransferase